VFLSLLLVALAVADCYSFFLQWTSFICLKNLKNLKFKIFDRRQLETCAPRINILYNVDGLLCMPPRCVG
jgi:hypothetical protein